MSLSILYMPLPAGAVARREEPLGPWDEPKPAPLTPAEKRARHRARHRLQINAREKFLRQQRKLREAA